METESCPGPWARVHRTPSDQRASLALSRRAHSETEAKVALQMALSLSGIVASPPNPKGGSWLSAPKSTGSWPGAWRAGPPLQVRLLCSELHPPHGRPFPTYDLLWALDLSVPRCLPPAGSQPLHGRTSSAQALHPCGTEPLSQLLAPAAGRAAEGGLGELTAAQQWGRQSGRRTPPSSGQRGKLSPSAGGSGSSTAIFNLNHSLPHLLGTGLLHTKLCSVGQSNRKTQPDPCRAAMLMPLERVRWRAAQPRGPGWGRGARAVPPLSHPGHLLGAAVSGSRTRSCAAHPGSGTGSPPALQP